VGNCTSRHFAPLSCAVMYGPARSRSSRRAEEEQERAVVFVKNTGAASSAIGEIGPRIGQVPTFDAGAEAHGQIRMISCIVFISGGSSKRANQIDVRAYCIGGVGYFLPGQERIRCGGLRCEWKRSPDVREEAGRMILLASVLDGIGAGC